MLVWLVRSPDELQQAVCRTYLLVYLAIICQDRNLLRWSRYWRGDRMADPTLTGAAT